MATEVSYEVTDSVLTTNKWLNNLPSLIACDFETACKFTNNDKELFTKELELDPPFNRQIELMANLAADALSHPYYVLVTHFQVAISPTQSYVFILKNNAIRNRIFNFITTTKSKQIWHNASFDLKHVYYHTNQFPLDFEDTAIQSRIILNHVDKHKAKAGLKDLASNEYGDWAINADNFNLSNLYDEALLKYAAIDPCATFWVYNKLQEYIKGINDTL